MPFGFHLAVDALPSPATCAEASEALPSPVDMAPSIRAPVGLQLTCARRCPAHTVDPSDTQRGFRLTTEVRAATPRSDGAPVLRHALCRRATPPTPVSDHMLIGRLLSRGPAAFPVFTAGRPSRHHFRALLGFTRVAARRLADPPKVGHCPESFGKSVALLAASVATGVHRQFPRPDLHRREHSTFSRRG
jgi:hypothetical protein